MIDIQNLRQEYTAQSLDEKDILSSPMQQFKKWLDEALNSQILEPNAMTLATADERGRPSARTLLLKGLEKSGFIFYTNYFSRKGRELASNPYASLVFLWAELQRQVRVEGVVERISREATITYFQSRPRGSQIGAWASKQSEEIAGRHVLEERMTAFTQQFATIESLPCPDYWGGYILKPTYIEFWQGRPSRLHDRIGYKLQENHSWKIVRLAP